MNDRGQALVEFILVVPVILLIFICLVDVGNIFLKKYDLNQSLNTAVELYENGDDTKLAALMASEEINYKEEKNGDFIKITIDKNVKVSAPILSNILGDNFKVSVSTNVYSKEDTYE